MKYDFCNGCVHYSVCCFKTETCDITDFIIAFSARVPKHMAFDFNLFCKFKKYNESEEENVIRQSDNEKEAGEASGR